MLQEHASSKEATKKATKDNPFTTLWNALLARNGTVAYLPIIFVAILMFCGASWQIFWSYTDAARYQCYALVFWLGGSATKLLPSTQCFFLNSSAFTAAPFHTLPLEYPPLTLAIFSLSLLAPIPYYQLLFALWMALTARLDLLALAGVSGRVGRRWHSHATHWWGHGPLPRGVSTWYRRH